MYIFGGMCGCRLNDLWELDIGEFVCQQKCRDLTGYEEIKLKYMKTNGILWCIENYTVVLTFRNS